MYLRISISIMLLLVISAFNTLSAQRSEPEKTEIQGHTMYTMLKPGDIPAIFDPQFISIKEADSLYYPDEPLIVVVYNDIARGYSAWHLDHHEIVNDVINGKMITVTW